MMNVCTVCGQLIDAQDAGYCSECRRVRAVTTPARWLETSGEIVADALTSPVVVYCPHCGAANSPGARVCIKCGKPL